MMEAALGIIRDAITIGGRKEERMHAHAHCIGPRFLAVLFNRYEYNTRLINYSTRP